MSQANSAEEHKLVSSFESVRRTLLQDEYRDRLDKPLAYWALPNDRRLPLAFLGRSLGDLLHTSFNELSSTRGIGQKKISSLVKLLHRATSDNPPAVPYGLKELADELEEEQRQEIQVAASGFDPSVVSEALWVQWCDTVRRFHLGREILGKLAPSLQSLPTVIWTTPLNTYLGKTVSEIRQLKTHGEKRVRVVLEVFHTVHELLQGAHPGRHLSLNLVPEFVPPIEDFVTRLAANEIVTASRQEIATNIVQPMLQQVLVDSGEPVFSLSRDRLGIGVPSKSVREQSREMGVTRARVYQLLEDCGKIMSVRWAEGGSLMKQLVRFSDPESKNLWNMTHQLFYPEKHDRAEEEDIVVAANR